MSNQHDHSLIYVWDAYCGWCYGFSKTFQAFLKNHPTTPLTILSGGLFTGENVQPMRAFPHIPAANDRISQLTGVAFGEPYQVLANKGSFMMDSLAAANGYAALRAVAQEHSYQLALSMQEAFYCDGKSLSDPQTYREIAEQHGLDPEKVVTQFLNVALTDDALRDFRRVRQLGIQSYPTLLLQKDDQLHVIGSGVMTADKIETRFQEVLSTSLH